MKKIAKILMVLALLPVIFGFTACGGLQSDVTAEAFSAGDFGTSFRGEASSQSFVFGQNGTVSIDQPGEHRTYYNKLIPSEKYMFTVYIDSDGNSTTPGADAPANTGNRRLGITNITSNGAFVDFNVESNSLRFNSCIVIYNQSMTSGAGHYNVIKPDFNYLDKIKVTVIRDGELFYFLANDELLHIRHYKCGPSQPGLSSYGQKGSFSDISVSDNESIINAAVAAATTQLKGWGMAAMVGTFPLVDIISESALTIKTEANNKVEQAVQIAAAERYDGNFAVSFDISDLAAGSSTSVTPRFDIIFCGNNYIPDRISLLPKNNNLQTYMHTEMPKPYAHGKYAPDSNNNMAVHTVRIERRAPGGTGNFSVYYDDNLVAIRKSGYSGAVKVGFQIYHVSAKITNFTVTALED